MTIRKVVNFICDRIVRNGWMGRQLPRLFWVESLRQPAGPGYFFGTASGSGVGGVK